MKRLTATPGKNAGSGLYPVCVFSGLLSTFVYIMMNVFIPMEYPGYNAASQTVSELSAIDAPTRSFWIFCGWIYGILLMTFGAGLWAAGDNRGLKTAGLLIFGYSALGLFWPPMHQREVLASGGATISDTLHIVFTFITIVCMLGVIVFASLSSSRSFRNYSYITIVILLVFGLLTGLDSKAMESNQPTPFMGVWERISIGAYMLWMIVLSTRLLSRSIHMGSTHAAAKFTTDHSKLRGHTHAQNFS